MAVPTITNVTPTTGTPTGGQLVEITGTNFRLPTAPDPVAIPVPVAPDSVRVTFGGDVSTDVSVISATRLLVVVPKHALPLDAQSRTLASEAVDIVVENIDDAGVLIPGETVTAASAYTYARPGISYAATPGTITAAVRSLVALLRSEALANVVIETAPDFDADTTTIEIDTQALPQLVLEGPVLTNNTFFTNRGQYTVDGFNAGEGFRKRRHRVVDLGFEIIGITDKMQELTNLIEIVEQVIDRNTVFEFEYPIGSGDVCTAELRWTRDPAYQRQPANPGLRSGLRLFRGAFSLVGVTLTGFPGVDQDNIQAVGFEVDVTTLEAPQQIGDNLPTVQGGPTRSPPNTDVPSPSPFPRHGGPTRSPPDTGAQE